MPSASYRAGDVVKVPFPFADRHAKKHRPALVISRQGFGNESGHSVMAMITSARQSAWPLDVAIGNLEAAGLPAECIVRMKLFTLDHRLIEARLGRLADADHRAVAAVLKRLF